jgi:hypothetical protein
MEQTLIGASSMRPVIPEFWLTCPLWGTTLNEKILPFPPEGTVIYFPRLCRIHSYFCPNEVLEPLWREQNLPNDPLLEAIVAQISMEK